MFRDMKVLKQSQSIIVSGEQLYTILHLLKNIRERNIVFATSYDSKNPVSQTLDMLNYEFNKIK